MLLRNIMTSSGLVNGATGVVEEIEFNSNRVVESIYVIFDDANVGRILQRKEKCNSIPITLYRQNFRYNGRSITRIQFPLCLSWACTIHKVQGLSLDKAVLSLGGEVFACGQAYVALSRIRQLQGLFLESFSPQKVMASKDVIDEYKRLRKNAH